MIRRKIKNVPTFKRQVLTEKTMKPIVSKIREKREEIYFMEEEIHGLVKKFIPEHMSMFNTIGTWKCKESPIGLCYYDHMEDRALDNCLFCHYPHERK